MAPCSRYCLQCGALYKVTVRSGDTQLEMQVPMPYNLSSLFWFSLFSQRTVRNRQSCQVEKHDSLQDKMPPISLLHQTVCCTANSIFKLTLVRKGLRAVAPRHAKREPIDVNAEIASVLYSFVRCELTLVFLSPFPFAPPPYFHNCTLIVYCDLLLGCLLLSRRATWKQSRLNRTLPWRGAT